MAGFSVTGMFQGLIGGASKLAQQLGIPKLATAAKQMGVTMPMDQDLKAVTDRKVQLKNKALTLTSMDTRVVNGLYALKTAQADIAARNLAAQIKAAKDAIQGTLPQLEVALAAGQSAQKALLAGNPSPSLTAVFYAKKATSDTAYARAIRQADDAIAKAAATSYQAAKPSKVSQVREAASIVGQTGSDFVRGAAEKFEDVGKGLSEVSPILRYLPHVALAVGAIWAYGQLKDKQPAPRSESK